MTMTDDSTLFYRSPVGVLRITGSDKGISSLLFCKKAGCGDTNVHAVVKQCKKQLEEYFEKKRFSFSVPLSIEGTPFQKKVWKALQQISYGKTSSYQDIAGTVGNIRAVRAVGGANNRNPVAIIVPCHRVIGKNGLLTGYGGGIEKKQWLLDFEAKRLLSYES